MGQKAFQRVDRHGEHSPVGTARWNIDGCRKVPLDGDYKAKQTAGRRRRVRPTIMIRQTQISLTRKADGPRMWSMTALTKL